MQPGSLIGGDIRHITTRVVVNGVDRQHVSWTLDGEISGDLPEQVVAGSGITQATGTIIWAASEDVSDASANPWNRRTGWLPSKGDSVLVYAGDGVSEWVQFTGVIDTTTGNVGGTVQSTVIDAYDQLSAQVSHPALLAVMPPVNRGGSYRGVGLVHTYYVDLAFRAARFFCTPQQEPGCVFHVPAQGGIWPHHGSLLTAGTQDGTGSYPSNNFASWGFAVSNFQATATPASSRPATDPVQLTAVIAESHAGLFYLRAAYGSSYVQLTINSSKLVSANIGTTVVASMQLLGEAVVQLLYKNGTVTLKASTGQIATGSGSLSGSMGTVTFSGQPGARVAGMQISHPSLAQEFRSIGFVRNARINTSNVSHMGVLTAVPAIQPQAAHELLDQISSATLSCMWINELGEMQWWPALAIQAQPVRDTLTTLDDILEMDWEDSLLGSRSKVSIKYLEPAIKISPWQNITVYEGDGATMESGEKSEEIVGPGSDEAWYGVDEDPTRLGTSSWALYNPRRGSFVGGFFSSEGVTTSESGLTLSIGFLKRGVSNYRITHTVGTLPADVSANLATSPTSPSLWDRNRDKPLPRLGAFGYAKWSDAEYSPVQVGGVGPELVHDGGSWIPFDIADRYFSYLSGKTSMPQPTVSGLEVVFDPRRQRGDIVRVSSPALLGVEMTALIVGLSTNADNGITQTLSVRILSVSRIGQTYAEFQNSIPGSSMTYSQWQLLGPLPETYDHFNTVV